MPFPTKHPIVWYGAHGAPVTDLREKLASLGFYSPEPGRDDPAAKFGAITDAAVRAFQSANGFRSDGIVDDAVWDAINALSAPES